MFLALPMQIAKEDMKGSVPIANTVIVIFNVLAYLILQPENWSVGTGTAPWTILTYGFVHDGWWHILMNMWILWVFGHAVNRRVGNRIYLLTYLGTIVTIGIVLRLFASGLALGASGGVFAVLAVALMLLPAARVDVHYLLSLPWTIIVGLIKWPKYGLFWIIRWGTVQISALLCVTILALLELVVFVFCCFYLVLSWSNLGHLLGLACGVAAVLMMPRTITRETG